MAEIACADVRRALPALLDGTLAAGDVDPIRTHIAACPRCGRLYAAFRRDELARAALARQAVPAPVPRAVGAKLPVQVERQAMLGHPAPRSSAWRWAAGGLLVALMIILAYTALLGYTAWSVSHRIYRALPPAPPPPTVVAAAAPTAPSMAGPPLAAPMPTEPSGLDVPAQPFATALPSPTPDAVATAAALLPSGRFNILVLGTDKRPEEAGEPSRSDTLMVVSVDPAAKRVGVLGIPRDLQVLVPGYGWQKINAAYFLGEAYRLPGGGPGLALPTVSQLLNVPIDYYVALNFAGFEKIIDAAGGVDIDVPAPIDDPAYPGPNYSYMHIHFDAGFQHMDGAQALQYARTRHGDSDFARIGRQQQVIRALQNKLAAVNMLPRYPALLNQLGDAVETNIPPDQHFALTQLATQLGPDSLYTAQFDYNPVYPLAGTSNLGLQLGPAHRLLDWFFARGAYAGQLPGFGPPPVP
jgi:LCP family protein required for cell wall assembly